MTTTSQRRSKLRFAKDQKHDARLVINGREFNSLREWAVKKLGEEEKKGKVENRVSEVLGEFYIKGFSDYKKELMNLDKKPLKTEKPFPSQDGKSAAFRLTDAKGKTIGFSFVSTTEEGKPYEQLVYIDPKHRGKRLSEKLTRANENLFFSKGHDELVLRVFNPLLKESLKKQGYEIIEEKDLKDKRFKKIVPAQGSGFLAVKKKKSV